MVVKEKEVAPEGDLVVDQKTLQEAGLVGRLRLIIRQGEIRILSESQFDPEKVLDELAGCLGQESATDYDFALKIGGFYEAR